MEFPGPYCLLRKKMWNRHLVRCIISSDQVSVLARKVLRKFPNPAVCEEKKKLLIILFAGESQF
jgi:hypothetical protein